MNLLFNVFEGSNEQNVKATEGRDSIMKHGETKFEGDDPVKKPAGLSM